jgi:hypothetical protein
VLLEVLSCFRCIPLNHARPLYARTYIPASLQPNKALQQTRRLFSPIAVRGSFGATPFGRRLSSAAGAAQLSA